MSQDWKEILQQMRLAQSKIVVEQSLDWKEILQQMKLAQSKTMVEQSLDWKDIIQQMTLVESNKHEDVQVVQVVLEINDEPQLLQVEEDELPQIQASDESLIQELVLVEPESLEKCEAILQEDGLPQMEVIVDTSEVYQKNQELVTFNDELQMVEKSEMTVHHEIMVASVCANQCEFQHNDFVFGHMDLVVEPLGHFNFHMELLSFLQVQGGWIETYLVAGTHKTKRYGALSHAFRHVFFDGFMDLRTNLSQGGGNDENSQSYKRYKHTFWLIGLMLRLKVLNEVQCNMWMAYRVNSSLFHMFSLF